MNRLFQKESFKGSYIMFAKFMRRFILVANKQTKKLRVIPLGGVDEIGKNMTAIEYGEDIVIIDCGSIFPKEDM